MTTPRQLSAAALAADSDDMRALWAAVGRGEVEVYDGDGDRITEAYLSGGDVRPITVLCADGFAYNVRADWMFTVRPPYAALQAERDRYKQAIKDALAVTHKYRPGERTTAYMEGILRKALATETEGEK